MVSLFFCGGQWRGMNLSGGFPSTDSGHARLPVCWVNYFSLNFLVLDLCSIYTIYTIILILRNFSEWIYCSLEFIQSYLCLICPNFCINLLCPTFCLWLLYILCSLPPFCISEFPHFWWAYIFIDAVVAASFVF